MEAARPVAGFHTLKMSDRSGDSDVYHLKRRLVSVAEIGHVTHSSYPEGGCCSSGGEV